MVDIKWLDDLEFGATRLRVGKLQVNKKNSPGMITISKNFSRFADMGNHARKTWCYRIYKICSSILSLRKKHTNFRSGHELVRPHPRRPRKNGNRFFLQISCCFLLLKFYFFYNSAQQIAQIQKLVDEILVVPEIRLKSSNHRAQILI